jgi:uncharacterized protein (TIGR03437 family)
MKLVSALLVAVRLWAGAPNYSASSIVNAASNVAGPIAPNTIVSLYGTELSWSTTRVTSLDADGLLPTYLPGAGVTISINNAPAALYYTSPTQINFLLPSNLRPGGRVRVIVVRDGVRGPEVELTVSDVAPALFQIDPDYVVATRVDGSAIGRENPALPGELITLYAAGLGSVVPALADRQPAERAARIARAADFRITLDGVAVPASAILYVGAAPGFVGLYQINLELPAIAREAPEIRIAIGAELSREGVRLLAKP